MRVFATYQTMLRAKTVQLVHVGDVIFSIPFITMWRVLKEQCQRKGQIHILHKGVFRYQAYGSSIEVLEVVNFSSCSLQLRIHDTILDELES